MCIATFVKRTLAFSVGLTLAAFLAGCENAPDPKIEEVSDPLVGRWVQVYPQAGALDTMILNADHSAKLPESGHLAATITGEERIDFDFKLWRTDYPLMPGGLCIGDVNRRWCVGFRLVGDTLALANLKGSVFLRLPSDGEPVAFSPWKERYVPVEAPAPGDSVRALQQHNGS